MNPYVKRLLAFALAASAVLGAALALPGLMNAVMADTIGTTVMFAQAAPVTDAAPHNTVMPAPTHHPGATALPPMPVLTPVPEQTMRPDTVTRLLPTPMPPEGPTTAWGVQPAALDQFLQRGDAGGLAKQLPKGWRQVLGDITEDDLARFQVFVAPQAITLAEDMLPRNLADQKLLGEIYKNLGHESIFVPGQDVLGDLMNLNIRAFTLGPHGELAALNGTNRLLMPLRVLEYAAMNGTATMAPQEYVDMRHSLLEQARLDMARTDSPALQRSLDIVAQLMWDDQPWQLSVIGAEPYTPEEAWAYYAWGHHIKAIDMRTGTLYTITTDLDGSRVIGMASEEAAPYLNTYGGLVETLRLMKPTDPQTVADASAYALKTLAGLAGIPFSQQEHLWQIEHGSGALVSADGDTMLEYRSVDASPKDADLRVMDSEANWYRTYSLRLDSNMDLEAYVTSLEPASGFSNVWKPIGPLNSDGQASFVRARDYFRDNEDPNAAKALEYVWENWAALVDAQMDNQTLKALGLQVKQPLSIEVSSYGITGTQRRPYEVQTLLEMTDREGKAYQMTLSTDLELNTIIGEILREE